jgi:hypothetical protein
VIPFDLHLDLVRVAVEAPRVAAIVKETIRVSRPMSKLIPRFGG